jgi:hypothetical protein
MAIRRRQLRRHSMSGIYAGNQKSESGFVGVLKGEERLGPWSSEQQAGNGEDGVPDHCKGLTAYPM